MKYILFILVTFSALLSNASHLAGGELTYKYISGRTYQINVTLYRDCNDCKLGGTGGGSSTKNCTDLDEVYLRTINSSCGDKTIGTISLSKIGIENITPICSTSKSKCDANATYPYGFEAHTYSGIVNFNNYSTYTGCMIQIFFHKSERSKDITNLTNEEDDLYNFALINPWIDNTSSPVFNNPPKILFNLYQASYTNDGVIANTGDSLSFKWGTPYSNYNNSIAYKSGYNAYNFTTTYCPGGGTCNANPNAAQPEGLFLNENTGDIVFTPIGNNEISTRVIEVEQWRKINGNYQLTGKIRRDVLVVISESNENNLPNFDLEDTYFTCIGQKFQLPLSISDLPYNAGGVEQKQDSIQISISSNLAGLGVQSTSLSVAPFTQTTLIYEAKTGDEGTYFIRVKATDNYCPEYGTSYKTIKLVIKSAPEFTFIVKDKFCGNNEIKLNANRNGTFGIIVEKEDSSILFETNSSSGNEAFQHLKNENLRYNFLFSDNFGCSITKTLQKQNTGNTSVKKASISGNKKVCENSSIKLKLEHENLSILNIGWYKNEEQLGNTTELTTAPYNGNLKIQYTLKQDELTCLISDSTTIELLPVTPILLEESKPICYAPTFNLLRYNPNPSNGLWSSDQELKDDNVLLTKLGNRDSFFNITYNYTNDVGCTSTKSLNIPILKSPSMELSNEAICGDKFEYRLKNAIELPYNPDAENITWKILNNPGALITSPFPAIDIPTYGTGIYSVIATNTYTNGCIKNDTGIITVDEGLELTTNGKVTICQQGEAINLENYLDLNATGGGWNSFTAGDLLELRQFTPKVCGQYDFKYTYDKNGCYDELDLNIMVICKPSFEIELPSAICNDYSGLNLPLIGTWQGKGVNQNTFNPSNLNGWIYLRNYIETDGCIFDTFISLEIIEPLHLEISSLPSKLCEGEQLAFSFNATDNSQITIESCNNSAVISNNEVIYAPNYCDLLNEEINLTVTQNSTAKCYLPKRSVSIPYFGIPTVVMPEPHKECWPYNVSQAIQTKEQNITALNYTIKSQNSVYSDSNKTINYTFPNFGNYSLHISTINEHGCSNIQSFDNQYILHPKPVASFTAGNKSELSMSERDVYFYNKSSVASGTNSYKWYWTKNNRIEEISEFQHPYYTFPADTGKFEVSLIAKSDKNCSDTVSENVWIVPDILVFIPNAFTPDNRGPIENAKFNVVSSNVKSFHIQIFNKWGQMVFESYDISNSWDGNYYGKICQTGVYVYSIKMINGSGLEYQYQGTVNLLR